MELRKIFIFALAMTVICYACKESFKNNQGLAWHRKTTCKKARKSTAHRIQKLEGKIEAAANAKRMKGKRLVQEDGHPVKSVLLLRFINNYLPKAIPDIEMDTGPSENPMANDQLLPTASGRRRTFPRHFKDYLPSLPTSLPHMPKPVRRRPPKSIPALAPPPPNDVPSSVDSMIADDSEPHCFETEPNDFGIYRSYTCLPSHDPEGEISLDLLCDGAGLAVGESDAGKWWSGFGSSALAAAKENLFTPFLNATVFRLMNWFYNGSNTKSQANLNRLVHEVILAPDFVTNDLHDFSAARELERLDEYTDGPGFSAKDGWKQSSVNIPLPAETVKQCEGKAPMLRVDGIWYRNFTEVIKAAFQDPSSKRFHFTPFKMFWQPPGDVPPERIITELYNSDAMLEEHEKIRSQPHEPGCTLETVVAAIMLWSDATHLANFGTASLWPIYCFFGNQSKYTRGKPTSFSAHHLAYIPSVRILLPYYCTCN
jgi:hypothetical protein